MQDRLQLRALTCGESPVLSGESNNMREFIRNDVWDDAGRLLVKQKPINWNHTTKAQLHREKATVRLCWITSIFGAFEAATSTSACSFFDPPCTRMPLAFNFVSR
jgi:hypothetical protein